MPTFSFPPTAASIHSHATYSGGPAAQVTSYDFIVVGGGTAGIAVATRLSQYLPHHTILVIEAGPFAPDEDRINIPGLKGSTVGTKYDWNFASTPQAAQNDSIINQARGKVLGGSSALNALFLDRASKLEYDAWGELGNPGWHGDSMTAAMNKAETFTNPGLPFYSSTTGYGTSGPINSVVNRLKPTHHNTWVPALMSLTVNRNTLWMEGENVGVGHHSNTIDPTHYNRSYSAVAYLPSAGSNLHIITEAEVATINLEKMDDGSFQATGVTVLGGEIFNARKEVIISAGTMKNPQLLELSGIGRSNILKIAGIEQKIELSGVGENLQDHPRINLSYQLKNTYTSFDKLKTDSEYAAQQIKLWRNGEPSAYDYASSACSYQAWPSIVGEESTNLVEAAERVVAASTHVIDQKKLEWLANPIYQHRIVQAEFLLSDGYSGGRGYPGTEHSLHGQGFTTITGGLMHQLARGSVHIRTSDPSVPPVYDPQFVSNEYDLRGLIAIAKYARKIATTPPFSDIWTAEYEPGFDTVQTDAEWEAYVRNNTRPFYHAAGTCAMLPRKEGGVVSPELMVYGTSNLRVVDASIIPVLLSAHPQSAVYGIAERAAELVAEKWRSSSSSAV